jgi:hypothetical protein
MSLISDAVGERMCGLWPQKVGPSRHAVGVERLCPWTPRVRVICRAAGGWSQRVYYANLGQASLSAENVKKAYALRDRVSEHEKYGIAALYYQNVLGS